MMKADVRRCRRCKRKRLEDEPPEVRQYKTCAKCRIIERNKKNSRKPLAEETMLYGLKQFREQASSDNYLEEEGLLKDEFFKRFHNKPFNYEAELQEVMSNPNYVSPVVNTSHNNPHLHRESQQRYTFKSVHSSPIPGVGSANNGAVVSKFQTYQQPKSLKPSGLNPILKPPKSQTTQSQQLQAQQQYQSQVYAQQNSYEEPEEDIFQEVFKLGNKEELSENEIYSITENDPYQFENVTGDFQKFLLKILHKRQNGEDLNNLVFLKEYNLEFTENLGRYDPNGNGPRAGNVRYGEKQLRTHLLVNLKSSYVDPIIATINLPYNQDASNLNDFRTSASIKGIYNFTPPTVTSVGYSKEYSKIKQSNIQLAFNLRHNLLIIKVNHFVFKPSQQIYSSELKEKVRSLFKKLEYQNSIQLNGVKSLEYNSLTGSLIFDKLLSMLDNYPDSLVKEVKDLKREDFIADFVNFDTVFKLSEEESLKIGESKVDDSVIHPDEVEHLAVNGVHGHAEEIPDHEVDEGDEEEEEDEEDEDEDEDEEDEDEDVDIDAGELPSEDELEDDIIHAAVPSGYPLKGVPIQHPLEPITKESSAEIVDPVFKPE
ncbi:uncharacterized protein RJT21DRAFT_116868 [Scheffersomyces amazonensis]|uniref:uncharacterized protein n=1 Tax=Scheffersomyces amazonensis TaxID=1078765 RepID=UPI00315DC6D6